MPVVIVVVNIYLLVFLLLVMADLLQASVIFRFVSIALVIQNVKIYGEKELMT